MGTSGLEPFSYVEIDIDGCSLTFGVGACTAALGLTVPRKCYNTYATCRKTADFDWIKVFRTLRLCQSSSNMPKGMNFFPVLTAPPSEYSSTVNIAGADEKLGPTGARATIKVSFSSPPYHDRYLDPYQAERVDGTAQIDEPGYDPATRGTLFSKLRARWPYYAGRPLRRVDTYVKDGVIVGPTRTRHYIITDMDFDADSETGTFEASDILDLTKNNKAVCPEAGLGALAVPVPAGSSGPFTLKPTGVGDASYPASGRACLGSEIVEYTRTGDSVTLVTRAVARTKEASHAVGVTFQPVFSVQNVRIDDVLEILLRDYAKIDPVFIPKAKWQAEIDIWYPDLLLTTNITKPTGISTLIGELAFLGISIWWDSDLQEIGLKANAPVGAASIIDLTDRNDILAASSEDNDDKRLTKVLFHSVQLDPSKSGRDNYDRLTAQVNLPAEAPWQYASQRIKEIYCRWFDHGADDLVGVISQRYLQRFQAAPLHYTLELDAKDTPIRLVDVLRIQVKGLTEDETGNPKPELVQVISRSEPDPGHRIRIKAQRFYFDARFAFIGPDDLPDFTVATEDQKVKYGFIGADVEPAFADGTSYYRII